MSGTLLWSETTQMDVAVNLLRKTEMSLSVTETLHLFLNTETVIKQESLRELRDGSPMRLLTKKYHMHYGKRKKI